MSESIQNASLVVQTFLADNDIVSVEDLTQIQGLELLKKSQEYREEVEARISMMLLNKKIILEEDIREPVLNLIEEIKNIKPKNYTLVDNLEKESEAI